MNKAMAKYLGIKTMKSDYVDWFLDYLNDLTVEQLAALNSSKNEGKLEPFIDFASEVWNGGIQQWAEHGYWEKDGRIIISILKNLDNGAAKEIAKLMMSSDFQESFNFFDNPPRELESLPQDEFEEEIDWHTEKIDKITDLFSNNDNQIIRSFVNSLSV